MNVYLLGLVGKWMSIVVLSLSSLFGNLLYHEDNAIIGNLNEIKNEKIVNQVVEYDTKVIYNSKLPNTVQVTLTEGKKGLSYTDSTGTVKILQSAVTKVVEQGTGLTGQYVGKITGYGPDCPGCSKVGNVSCKTKYGKKHSLIYDGVYYVDDEYGKVRILAAATSAFPCGTVVYVDNGRGASFFGIVMDSGSSMRNAWTEGNVWMDVAYSSQNEARTNGIISGNNIKYQVKRWGW